MSMLNGQPTDGANLARVDPTGGRTVDWSAARERSQGMAKWTDRAVELAADAASRRRPGRLALWRNRRRAAAVDRSEMLRSTRIRPVDPPRPSRLRLIPPVAALGTAFVLQVVAMTDTVGGALARSARTSEIPWVADHPEVGYLAAMLLGIAVASCAEGGAAYLMDLYDKHLVARDSVWVLRLAMFGYVGASAGVIHWWLDRRELPTVVSWVLAGMSGSALFLWSRGSRWRNRKEMRDAGQLDPAMPRLSAAAKLLHPVRWIVTLYLVSWEPVGTTDEARARYQQWSDSRRAKKAAKQSAGESEPAAPAPESEPVDQSDEPVEGDPTDEVDDPTGDRPVYGPTALADAAFLREEYGDDPAKVPGRNELYRLHGGNAGRWSNALRAYRTGADQSPDHLDRGSSS